jgi:hypothetical protein
LNQDCALDWLFESKLRGGPLKIFFQHYRPIADAREAQVEHDDQPEEQNERPHVGRLEDGIGDIRLVERLAPRVSASCSKNARGDIA